MKKIVLALMLAVPMLVNAQQKEFTAEHFEAVPSYVEFANGRCQIDVKLSIPHKFMRKTTVAELVPVFRWQDGLTNGDTRDILTVKTGDLLFTVGGFEIYRDAVFNTLFVIVRLLLMISITAKTAAQIPPNHAQKRPLDTGRSPTSFPVWPFMAK